MEMESMSSCDNCELLEGRMERAREIILTIDRNRDALAAACASAEVERDNNAADVRTLEARIRKAESIIGDISGDIAIFTAEMQTRIRAFLAHSQSDASAERKP
jgi:hypothetical protein